MNKNFKKYSLEFLVIIFGILISFFLEERRQNSIEISKKNDSIKQLLKVIEEDLNQIDRFIVLQNFSLNSCNLIFENLKKNNIMSNDSIMYHLSSVGRGYSAAPKLEKKNFRIDWSKSAMSIHNLIRGLSPYIEKDLFLKDISICPCAWFVLKMKDKEKRVKLYLTELISKDTRINEITTDNKSYLHFNLNDYSLSIIYLQIEGKGIMNIKSFLSGYKFNNDWKFL